MKQIFLIGDSIRLGYCEYLKELLQDKAEVIYPLPNCRSSQNIIENLPDWVNLCDAERVEIVQFNCGQWDAAHFNYSPEPLIPIVEYVKNLKIIVRCLRQYFPKAKLVFATTTPMNPEHPETENPRTTYDIMQYNEAALSVMQEFGVAINDLFAVTKDWGAEYFIDYCHLTEKGYRLLGESVAEYLNDLL